MTTDPRESASPGIPGIYARLTERELASKDLFIAEGVPVIMSALDRGIAAHSLLMPARHAAGKAKSLVDRLPGVPVYTADDDELEKLTGFRLTRSVLAAMYRPEELRAQDVCRAARRVVLLEDLTDSTNVGAIFRSAAALGIDAVLLTASCCDPLLRRSVRVSMGAVFRVPWARVPDGAAGVGLLRGEGFASAALALTPGAIPLSDPRLRGIPRLALLIGSEGPGLREDTVRLCDHAVRIPMARGVDSLNAAAAAAVAFWETRADREE